MLGARRILQFISADQGWNGETLFRSVFESPWKRFGGALATLAAYNWRKQGKTLDLYTFE